MMPDFGIGQDSSNQSPSLYSTVKRSPSLHPSLITLTLVVLPQPTILTTALAFPNHYEIFSTPARAAREKAIVRLLARAVLAANVASSFHKFRIDFVFALVSANAARQW
jgi:hypothetical protein